MKAPPLKLRTQSTAWQSVGENLGTFLTLDPGGTLTAEVTRDPTLILSKAGMTPDPWQSDLLRSRCSRMLLNCSRQSGKSQTTAALALKAALLDAPALVLLLSPTQRQSGELFRDKLLPLWRALGSPCRQKSPTQLTLELANGSRIISLPGDGDTIRGYSGVKLIAIDEAARVPDSLYFAVRPMLAVSQGTLVALSTPNGKQGWFYDAWEGTEQWERVHIRADECPRISPEFLEEERAAIGDRWYRQEYEGSFEDVIDAVFSGADIAACFTGKTQPLFATGA